MHFLKIFIQKYKIAAILCVIVGASFIFHAMHRADHFQECDSTLTFATVRARAENQLSGIIDRHDGREANAVSRRITAAVFSISFTRDLILQQSGGEFSREEIELRMSKKNPIGLIRMLARNVLYYIARPLPSLQSGFVIAFVTTYSPGAGFLYDLLSGSPSNPDIFIPNAVFLTQLLFHVSVLMLYAIGRRLGITSIPAATGALLMLFSISMYSFGYHLGSVMWGVFTGFLWIFIAVRYHDVPKGPQIISIITGVLIFFNYLIIYYWVSYLVVLIFQTCRGRTEQVASQLRRLVTSQFFAIALIGICVAFFYPSGQGNRATALFAPSLTSQTSELLLFFSNIYYIILNYFSLYNKSTTLDFAQFFVATFLLGCGCFHLFKTRENQHKIFWGRVFLAFTTLLLLSFIFKILGFAPFRQMLYFAPLIFLVAMMGLEGLFSFKRYSVVILAIVVIIGGIGGVLVRSREAAGKITSSLTPIPGVPLKIFDCSYDLRYRRWPGGGAAAWADPRDFHVGQWYSILSQTHDIGNMKRLWREQGYNFESNIIPIHEESSSVGFVAYDPMHFLFNRTNGFYYYLIKINDVGPPSENR